MASYTEERINDVLNSRAFTAVMGVVFAMMAFLAFKSGTYSKLPSIGNGIFYSVGANWANATGTSFMVNLLGMLGVVVLSIMLNKMYSFIRTVTFIFGTMFMVLCLAFPIVCAQFNMGTLLCLVTILGQFVMFSTYQQKAVCQQRVFLVFAGLSFCTFFHYSFFVLVVAFIVGFIQMRGMNFRGVLAMLLGIATPYWILIGMGVINPATAMLPSFGWIWKVLPDGQVPLLITMSAIVGVLAVALVVVNMFTILNYRLQLRVYNSFYIVLTILAIIMMLADMGNMFIYIPLLNYCLAIQIAHTFTIKASFQRRYIVVLVIMIACLANYLILV